jgi:hypothetical protein
MFTIEDTHPSREELILTAREYLSYVHKNGGKGYSLEELAVRVHTATGAPWDKSSTRQFINGKYLCRQMTNEQIGQLLACAKTMRTEVETSLRNAGSYNLRECWRKSQTPKSSDDDDGNGSFCLSLSPDRKREPPENIEDQLALLEELLEELRKQAEIGIEALTPGLLDKIRQTPGLIGSVSPDLRPLVHTIIHAPKPDEPNP